MDLKGTMWWLWELAECINIRMGYVYQVRAAAYTPPVRAEVALAVS